MLLRRWNEVAHVSSVNFEHFGLYDISGCESVKPFPGHMLPLPQSLGSSCLQAREDYFHCLHLYLVIKTIITIIY